MTHSKLRNCVYNNTMQINLLSLGDGEYCLSKDVDVSQPQRARNLLSEKLGMILSASCMMSLMPSRKQEYR